MEMEICCVHVVCSLKTNLVLLILDKVCVIHIVCSKNTHQGFPCYTSESARLQEHEETQILHYINIKLTLQIKPRLNLQGIEEQGFWYYTSLSELLVAALAVLCVGLIPSEPERLHELNHGSEELKNLEIIFIHYVK
ncbi:hypothetical protein AMECASPLE_032034 [Ameca splendens]|uniref:Uncharacterized protein n=1 Tax=Ameca splendens TaxID=208324 RepID=A0ABV0ZSA3_9TELE